MAGVFNDTGRKGFVASAATAIPQYSRVYISAAGTYGNAPVVSLAGATNQEIGVVDRYVKDAVGPQAEAVNQNVDVILNTKQGTIPMIADGVINIGAAVYSAASGQVSASSATSNSHLIGYALEAASAAGDVIEILPL